MRLFFAIEVNGMAAERLSEAARRLGGAAGGRWARGGHHMTMAFLGEVPSERAAAAERAGRRAAALAAPFAARLRGTGLFGDVLWAGLADPVPARGLAAALARELALEGFPLERRPFAAHVTLARGVREVPAGLEGLDGAGFEARELVLFESFLSSSPVRHEARARLPLGAPA